jgi:hypothetical protein
LERDRRKSNCQCPSVCVSTGRSKSPCSVGLPPLTANPEPSPSITTGCNISSSCSQLSSNKVPGNFAAASLHLLCGRDRLFALESCRLGHGSCSYCSYNPCFLVLHDARTGHLCAAVVNCRLAESSPTCESHIPGECDIESTLSLVHLRPFSSAGSHARPSRALTARSAVCAPVRFSSSCYL